jgi:hypothetical protein
MICGVGRSEHGRCQTVVDGRYTTAVTIYNPTTCPVTLEKHFAPLVLTGEAVGREPQTSKAGPSPSSSLSLAKPRGRTASRSKRPWAALLAVRSYWACWT